METEKKEPQLTTIEMLKKLQHSKDTNCANLAKKLLANETTAEVELKFAGPFMTYVLQGCFEKALLLADKDNREALNVGGVKYVWLNPETGKFSNSWQESTYPFADTDTLIKAAKDGWKLIKYECLNDENFEFMNQMKLR